MILPLIGIGLVVGVLLLIWQVFVAGTTIGAFRLWDYLEPDQPLGKRWPVKVAALVIVLGCGVTILQYCS